MLILTLLFNTVVIPVTAEGDNNNREIENPLNVDYVLPAWGEDTDETVYNNWYKAVYVPIGADA